MMRSVLAFVCVMAWQSAQSVAQPLATAFAFQGELRSGGSPATGLNDLRFTLFDAASGGSPVGSTRRMDNVAVTEGLFTTTIDIGQQFMTTEARFLQIEVRPDTGLDCSNPAGLILPGPRQRGAPVEVGKPDREKGTYRHPELYGGPAENGMNDDPGRATAGDAVRNDKQRSTP